VGPHSLRAANRPHTTRYNYQLAVTQLADFLGGPELPAFLAKMDMPADDDRDAAEDRCRTATPWRSSANRTGKLVPVVSDDELARLLDTCRGKSYRDRPS